ncbi:Universal stress protein F [Aliiroseovarius sp. xm-m-379]|uniref:universal stress protein n=1 Tax=unclassified Aliiroseovarius TaxID=2623558 RepID=UPI0015693D26|nr:MULTISPECIES: universal stress protein [unclassified Aliiroseovarius]NRP14264.1 Universal stress protein F [Aliiroseovarius sp. xm-d-517]NRP23748.1 Universal stress protein F [Aliiroseovarius sp. xm-m-379]NRP29005.1 Universal stress protein F [Aliiroseovarius sp. xm-m-314]NRP32547.1 Universal stress protein F [Aliiroseovarius sp. xm-a-104]NRP41080.1 Universal stress protein F [Aliiroseovarius sp. xm-m-339-2]
MYKNILVPIALDHDRDSNQSLKIAKVLADEGAKITALHVMEEIPSYVAQYLPEGQISGNAHQLEDRLQQELADMPGVEAKVVSGHAGHAIVDYATRHDVDCIVVASHRPGLTDFLLGSTAARVVRHAPCCVHVSR